MIRSPLERLSVLEKRNQTLQTVGSNGPQERLSTGLFLLFFGGVLWFYNLATELSAGEDKTVKYGIEEGLQIGCSVGAQLGDDGGNHVEETDLLANREKRLLEDLLRGANNPNILQLASGNIQKAAHILDAEVS